MFTQKGYIFMCDLTSCHNSKSYRTLPERKGMPILEWPENLLDMNPGEYTDKIGNQIQCKKTRCGKWVCEAWYSVTLNVLEELYKAMSRRIADLMKAKRDATIYWLYDVAYTVIVFSFEYI